MRKLTIGIILIFSLPGLNAQLKQKLGQAIDKIEPKCIEWRRQIHQYPELGNSEFKTAKLISILVLK